MFYPQRQVVYSHFFLTNLIILIKILSLSPLDIVLAITENRIARPVADEISQRI